MPYIKQNDKFRFTPKEWLTPKQIKSFFSTLTQNRRKNTNSMILENTLPPPHSKSKKNKVTINEFKSISDSRNNMESAVDHDGIQDTAFGSDYEIDSIEEDTSDEDTNDEDFDARINALDMEDILTKVREVLPNRPESP